MVEITQLMNQDEMKLKREKTYPMMIFGDGLVSI
jgi:hypothetical protein